MHLNLFLANFSSASTLAFTKADLAGSNFVFLVLSILISLSLISQFYSKASPVHKVIALLLLSVLAVFLWVYETQFLFVYLVYILAFVGAVLMLFLSVVLILPISTTSPSVSNAAFFAFLMSAKELDLISPRPALSNLNSSLFSLQLSSLWTHKLLVLLLFVLFVSVYVVALKIADSLAKTNNVAEKFELWLSQFSFILTARCSNTDPSSFFAAKNLAENPLLQLWGQTTQQNNTPFHFLDRESELFNSLHQLSPAFALNVERLYNHLVVIETIVYGFFRYPVYENAKSFIVSRYQQVVSSKTTFNLFTRQFAESLVSLYLLLNLFVLVIPSINGAVAVSDTINTTFGLSELRSALYDKFGWFLLLSTIVLLVALLGVAVITRNKK